jgi:hypothetical protein
VSTMHHVPVPSDVPREPCPTCRQGCGCDPGKGESCEHYGCWGRDAVASCPGVIYEVARYETEKAHQRARARLVAMRKHAHGVAYARAVAQATDRAREEVAARIAERRPTVQP